MNNRFLLKISGEILKNHDQSAPLSWDKVDDFCKNISAIVNKGYQFGIVVGGGNIFRGASGNIEGYDRIIGDQIGMMSTIVNGLCLKERFLANGVYSVLQSGIKVDGVADLFDINAVEETFDKNGVVIFSGGIGNPYFSTDTTCALRALEIKAEYIFKATKVDGVYDKDPVKFPDAKKFDKISYEEVITKKLEIMDLTAMLLMQKHNMKLMVFNMNDYSLLLKACQGKNTGTIVHS